MFNVTVGKKGNFETLELKVRDFDALYSLLEELLDTEESDKLVFNISTVTEESGNDVER